MRPSTHGSLARRSSFEDWVSGTALADREPPVFGRSGAISRRCGHPRPTSDEREDGDRFHRRIRTGVGANRQAARVLITPRACFASRASGWRTRSCAICLRGTIPLAGWRSCRPPVCWRRCVSGDCRSSAPSPTSSPPPFRTWTPTGAGRNVSTVLQCRARRALHRRGISFRPHLCSQDQTARNRQALERILAAYSAVGATTDA